MAVKDVQALKDIGVWGERTQDPLRILEEQNAHRIPDLLPIRRGRMLESPFAFYRGAAAVMASDLADSPRVGGLVMSCGDAHLSNFGFYGSPERHVVFDVNDFDEGGLAPWDWDLKRLVTSVHLAAQQNGASDDDAWDASRRTARAYRKALRQCADMTSIDRFYAEVDTTDLQEILLGQSEHGHKKKRAEAKDAAAQVAQAEKRARKRTSAQALKKFAVNEDGATPQLVDQPPLTRHTDFMDAAAVRRLYADYLGSVSDDVRHLLQGFTVQDVVLRVVGVGSVGTRCFIVLLQDADGTELLLQFKEAGTSVLQSYGGIPQPGKGNGKHSNGHRVVRAQRTLQAQSDRFIGWMHSGKDEYSGPEGVDYYWRQFRDMKGSVDLSALGLEQLTDTAKICASVLARAHSQSRAAVDVAPLLRGRRDIDSALADAAREYSVRTVDDHAALAAAVRSGKLAAETGI